MSTSHSEPRLQTYKAGGVVAIHSFVKFGADDEHVVQSAAGTDANVGIAMNAAAAAEDPVEVALPGGGGKLRLAATLARGTFVASDASGDGVAPIAANRLGAFLQESGVDNDIVAVEVVAPTIL